MRVLGFTAVEVLPALLRTFGYNDDPDQTGKTQTVRPAWRMVRKDGWPTLSEYLLWEATRGVPMVAIPKEPYYHIDETVQVMWKQRSSPAGSRFCKKTGMIVADAGGYCDGCMNDTEEREGKLCCDTFPKILGLAKINAVFKVSMHLQPYEDRGSMALVLDGVGHELSFLERNREIPERDGFRSLSFMFEYFDKAYGLSTPKPFWVYRWGMP